MDVEKLQTKVDGLVKSRDVKAKQLERARARTSGRFTPASNRSLAADLAEELTELDKKISAKRAELEKEKARGRGGVKC
jgi:hypothetical protein